MTFPAILNTNSLNSTNGFSVTSTSDAFGNSVAGTGDINGDNKADFVVGAYKRSEIYVVLRV